LTTGSYPLGDDIAHEQLPVVLVGNEDDIEGLRSQMV
jgi:hypothetical protein